MNWEKCLSNDFWDSRLTQLSCPSYMQYSAWGTYKERKGEVVCRYLSKENDEIKAMVQCFIKKVSNILAVVWVPGGPAGDLAAFDKTFYRFLKNELKVKFLYIRLFSHYIRDHKAVTTLNELGWKNFRHKKVSPYSMMVNLDRDLEGLKSSLTKNWRHNLKRSGKKPAIIQKWEKPDSKEMRALFHSMEKIKGIGEQFSEEEISHLLELFGDNIHLLQCSDPDGNLIAIRACLTIGDHSWDLFAAANDKARRVYASYGLLWNLLSHCHANNIKRYDLSGVDKKNNLGVYNFKKGTGADHIEYLGEWDMASSKILRFLIKKVIHLKRKLQ